MSLHLIGAVVPLQSYDGPPPPQPPTTCDALIACGAKLIQANAIASTNILEILKVFILNLLFKLLTNKTKQPH
jgi:hypothetical protein